MAELTFSKSILHQVSENRGKSGFQVHDFLLHLCSSYGIWETATDLKPFSETN